MIQFNLLPDVKLEYIKAARTKRLVIAVSLLASIVTIVLVGLLLSSVLIFQANHLKNLNTDISKYRGDLERTSDINKILTIQNQLNRIPGLHDGKPAVSRTFEFLSQLTPANVNIGKIDIQFATNAVEIVGTADSISDVNKFVDTLKFTVYKVEEDEASEVNAFSEVVLSDFSPGDKVSYRISLKFDPAIFDNTKNLKLIVPSITTTRSEIEKPTESQLFQSLEGVEDL